MVGSKRGYTTDKAAYKESSERFKDESEGLRSMNGEEIDRIKEETKVIYE
jgi:hypothetical protein